MKNVIRSLAFCVALFSSSVSFALSKTVCSVEFKLNSSVMFEKNNELKSCLDKINPQKIQSVFIIGSATPTGTMLRNKQLANERAQSISRVVHLKFPKVSIEKISIGVSGEIGKKSQAYFLINDLPAQNRDVVSEKEIEQLKKKYTALETDFQKLSVENQQLNLAQTLKETKITFYPYRFALRLGGDNTRGNVVQNYLSIGGEFSFFFPLSNFQAEVGLQTSTSTNQVHLYNDWVQHISNAYLFLGLEKNWQGVLFGGRILPGYEWIDINELNAIHNHFALGGEIRLGYQWDSGLSLVASYGITKHLQMIDAALGYSF